jgi:hypothetical protein
MGSYNAFWDYFLLFGKKVKILTNRFGLNAVKKKTNITYAVIFLTVHIKLNLDR